MASQPQGHRRGKQRRSSAVEFGGPPTRGRTWLLPLAVGCLAVLAYANSLSNGFVWDDQIILSRQLVVFRSLHDVLLPPRGIPQYSPDYYRPLTVASYLLDRASGGETPLAFHLSVVLVHAVVAMLVYVLGRELFGQGKAALFGAVAAAALFAVHPVHTESVAWAAGRSDVLATCFMLAALIVHVQAPWSFARSIVTGVLALAALGAKENAVALYPLLLLADVLITRHRLHPEPGVGGWLRHYSGPFLAAAVYVALRRAALGEFVGSAPGEAPISESLGDIAGAFGAYLGKLVWPVGLNAYIDQVSAGPVQLVLATLFGLAATAAVLLWWKRGSAVPMFLVVWLGLTLSPSLTIVWKIPDAPMAERYLYLPSVGFCLLIGYAAMRARETSSRGAVTAAVALVLAAGMIGTFRRNRVWHDDLSLWQDTARKSHVSGMALRSLGTAYQQDGRIAEARRSFEQALERPNSARGLQIIHNNLGTIAMRERNFAAAQRHYEEALRVNPNAPDTLFNLGLAILYGGESKKAPATRAIDYFLQAQKLSPYDPDIDAALGQAYSITGDETLAVRHLRRALDGGVQPATAKSVKALLAILEAADAPSKVQPAE